MCGRYVASTPISELVDQFGVDHLRVEEDPGPSWNVAPTRPVLAVTTSGDGRQRRLDVLRWGLVPSWAKDPKIGNRMINARAETVATNRSYSRAFAGRRCIIPADGYFEWKAVRDWGKVQKVPYFFHPADGRPFAMGGLWEVWHDAEGKALATCTIITTEANAVAAAVHDRMPLLLPPWAWNRWLAPTPLDSHEQAEMLVPAGEGVVESRRVGTAVNDVKNDGAELITAAGEPGTAAEACLPLEF